MIDIRWISCCLTDISLMELFSAHFDGDNEQDITQSATVFVYIFVQNLKKCLNQYFDSFINAGIFHKE